MSDETLPQPRQQKSREFLAVSEIDSEENADVESVATVKTDVGKDSDLSKVAAKQDNKDGRGLHLRISKFLARNRCGKQLEEISIGSSKTADTRSSSLSNESRIDRSKRASSSSIFPRIGSQLKKLIKLKSQREIKTEEEVVIVVPDSTDENSLPISAVQHDDLGREAIARENAISENPATIYATNEDESVVSVQSSDDDTGNRRSAIIIAQNPAAVLVGVAALTGQLGTPQAEVQIQTLRRNPRDPTAPTRTPFLYLQEEEPRIQTYMQNMLGGERDSITTGSESSSGVSEVVDANEQPEGHDAAEQYYKAVLRAVIRKQFRHLDDEPPIY